MNRWDAAKDGEIYRDIQALEDPTLSLYALESFAVIVEDAIQEQLFRKLVLSHAEIAQNLELVNQQLAESEKRLTEAQQIARLGRWDIDYCNDTRYWSESLYDILALDHTQEPTSELFLSRIHPEDRPHIEEIMQKLLVLREPWTDRYRMILPDGTTRWVHVRLNTDFDENGKPVHSYGTLQDITAMKAAEDELENYNKHLQDMVADKVREISESQMATIFALVKLAESRDDETGAHIERTASFCRLLAQKHAR